MRSVQRALLILTLLAGTALTATAAEEPRQRIDYDPSLRDGMRVGLEVLVEGQPLAPVRHAGKTYLPVPRLGVEYEIRVWSHGPRRVAAIVSVDGLSVINGRPASESSPGYLIDPSGSIRIKGWRRDLGTVAAFSFQEREKSYAVLMGHPENVGVIGLIAIEEAGWRLRPLLDQKDAAGASAERSTAVGGTGTGYGRDVDSPAYWVPFVRSDNKRTIAIYYDTVEALRKAGIPVDRPSPTPFPGGTDFAPPPPRHRGK